MSGNSGSDTMTSLQLPDHCLLKTRFGELASRNETESKELRSCVDQLHKPSGLNVSDLRKFFESNRRRKVAWMNFHRFVGLTKNGTIRSNRGIDSILCHGEVGQEDTTKMQPKSESDKGLRDNFEVQELRHLDQSVSHEVESCSLSSSPSCTSCIMLNRTLEETRDKEYSEKVVTPHLDACRKALRGKLKYLLMEENGIINRIEDLGRRTIDPIASSIESHTDDNGFARHLNTFNRTKDSRGPRGEYQAPIWLPYQAFGFHILAQLTKAEENQLIDAILDGVTSNPSDRAKSTADWESDQKSAIMFQMNWRSREVEWWKHPLPLL